MTTSLLASLLVHLLFVCHHDDVSLCSRYSSQCCSMWKRRSCEELTRFFSLITTSCHQREPTVSSILCGRENWMWCIMNNRSPIKRHTDPTPTTQYTIESCSASRRHHPVIDFLSNNSLFRYMKTRLTSYRAVAERMGATETYAARHSLLAFANYLHKAKLSLLLGSAAHSGRCGCQAATRNFIGLK